MKRPVTFWYTKDQPIFENTEDFVDTRIDVTRIPAGSDTPPCLKISHNTFETMEKANWEFLRLSLPVICLPTFIEWVVLNPCVWRHLNLVQSLMWGHCLLWLYVCQLRARKSETFKWSQINPLPALTYQTVLDWNAACQSKHTEMYWLFSSQIYCVVRTK